MPRRVIAIVTDELHGSEPIEQLQANAKGVDVERTGRGTVNPIADKEVADGAYIPGMTRSDLAGMIAGLLGTIIVAILAAAVAGGSGHESGWEAVAILIAIGVALANLAHVVGLGLFESIRYR